MWDKFLNFLEEKSKKKDKKSKKKDKKAEFSATGDKGFEGLIAKLLQSLTDYQFFIAKSGSQGGSDMSSEEIHGNIIKAECKYLFKTKSRKNNFSINLIF